MKALAAIAALSTLVLGCASGPNNGEDDFLQCEGQCDTAGSVTVSSTWVPVDGFVRAISASGDIAVTPLDGVVLKGSPSRRIITFARPGFYTIAASPGAAGVRIRVSDDGPSIELLDPQPGEFVELGSSATITVSGRASDPLGEPIDLTVDGKSISVSADGSFSATIPLQFGVNIVELAASDVAGNEFTAPRSFLAAGEFTNDPQNALVSIDNTALAFLASIVTRTLPERVKIGSVEGPIGTSLGHDLFFDGATLPGQDGNPGELELQLRAVGDEVELKFLVTGTAIARGHIDGLLDSTATVGIIDPKVTIMLKFDGGLAATVTDIEVVDSGVELDLTGILSLVEDLFTEKVRDEVALSLETIAPSLIAAVLGSLDGETLVDTTALKLDTPLTLRYRLNGLTIANNRMRVDLAAQVRGAPPAEIEAPTR